MADSPSHEDHILVRTVHGEVKSLPISEITDVKDLHPGQTCRVLYQTPLVGMGNTRRVLDLQEPREVFQARCEALQQALLLKDEPGITRHFAPDVSPRKN